MVLVCYFVAVVLGHRSEYMQVELLMVREVVEVKG